jgi:hypothetical protein
MLVQDRRLLPDVAIVTRSHRPAPLTMASAGGHASGPISFSARHFSRLAEFGSGIVGGYVLRDPDDSCHFSLNRF